MLDEGEIQDLCSTPFGITDYIGRARTAGVRVRRRGRVLNAFRHHGLYRRTHLQPRHDGTPRVLNAFRHHGLYRSASPPPASSPASGAQRLSASRIISGARDAAHAVAEGDRVLNAFRHHGLYRSRPSMADSIAAVSAQRLSASRIISADRSRRRIAVDPPVVLNAFRHHGLYRGAGLSFGCCGAGLPVLNAFRHHGLYRPPVQVSAQRDVQVLNAFRHHGLYRGRVRSTAAYSARAQRLSASRIISGGLPLVAVWAGVMCSTPFGITDYIGCHPALDVRRAPGAQRLSASRIISAAVLRDLPSRALTCSTPFGITDYIGPWRLCCPWRALRVLNAFRHHGLYRSTATRMVRSPNVLNAFRHHGLYRWEAVTGRYARLRCSTPFGITDYIGRRPTWRRRCCGCRAQRLSASRIISVVLPLDVCRRQPCSTPFGITDYIGRRWCRSGRGAWSPGAQRLSASRIISGHQAPLLSPAGVRVLNAFRHHGLYRWCGRVAQIRRAASAQRLSASRIISVLHYVI